MYNQGRLNRPVQVRSLISWGILILLIFIDGSHTVSCPKLICLGISTSALLFLFEEISQATHITSSETTLLCDDGIPKRSLLSLTTLWKIMWHKLCVTGWLFLLSTGTQFNLHLWFRGSSIFSGSQLCLVLSFTLNTDLTYGHGCVTFCPFRW